jgi:raffinose/stachyose/melibiose transport system permease protein
MDKMLGKKRYIAIFVMPALLLFLCFVVAPLVVTGIYSLFEYDWSRYYEILRIK